MSHTVSRIALVTLATMTLLLAGCKNDSESALSDVVDYQKDMLKILKGVTDKSSAEAAKAKLEALTKKMSETNTKFDKKKMNDAEMTKAMEKYKPEMEQVTKDIQAEMMRIMQNPELVAALGGPMGGFGPGTFGK